VLLIYGSVVVFLFVNGYNTKTQTTQVFKFYQEYPTFRLTKKGLQPNFPYKTLCNECFNSTKIENSTWSLKDPITILGDGPKSDLEPFINKNESFAICFLQKTCKFRFTSESEFYNCYPLDKSYSSKNTFVNFV
jgi:hypothetical protein